MIKVHIDRYKIIAGVDDTFTGAFDFDNRCGIRYVNVDDKAFSFIFEVKDEKRYLLAKIAYGI